MLFAIFVPKKNYQSRWKFDKSSDKNNSAQFFGDKVYKCNEVSNKIEIQPQKLSNKEYLKIAMYNWRLAVMQARHCLAHVTEYPQHFAFSEANRDAIIHLSYHRT